jgi:hypothetical protein
VGSDVSFLEIKVRACVNDGSRRVRRYIEVEEMLWTTRYKLIGVRVRLNPSAQPNLLPAMCISLIQYSYCI